MREGEKNFGNLLPRPLLQDLKSALLEAWIIKIDRQRNKHSAVDVVAAVVVVVVDVNAVNVVVVDEIVLLLLWYCCGNYAAAAVAVVPKTFGNCKLNSTRHITKT